VACAGFYLCIVIAMNHLVLALCLQYLLRAVLGGSSQVCTHIHTFKTFCAAVYNKVVCSQARRVWCGVEGNV
jgi:uncharacterized membrane protein